MAFPPALGSPALSYLYQDTSNPGLGHTASYTYDALNRLTNSVATGSSTHNLTFSYDRFGNMTCVTNAQTQGACPGWSFSALTNRMTNANFTYDAAGNLTQDGTGVGTHTYQWDAENRLKSVDNGTTATYIYNALGLRVEKQVGAAYTEVIYNTASEPVGENNRTTWTQSFVPFSGRHLAHYQSGVTYFPHANTLKSTTTVSDYSGAMTQDQLYYPFGQEWAMAGTMQEDRFAQLGHRDAESALDPTFFRMYSSGEGRWMTTDPKSGFISNPQTLNLYAYVSNLPTSRKDPRGDCPETCQYPGDVYCGPDPGIGIEGIDFAFVISNFGGGDGCDIFTRIRCSLCKGSCEAIHAVAVVQILGSCGGSIAGAVLCQVRLEEENRLFAACLSDCARTWCSLCGAVAIP